MTFLSKELEGLKKIGWYRRLHSIDNKIGPYAEVDGRPVIIFSSNNYLGLTHHPEVIQASQEALGRYGTGSTGSRLTTGNLFLHEKLEHRLSEFKQTEKALLFSSGYLANVGVISTLMKKRDVIFSDELNHASIKDGCRLSGATVLEYRHGDTDHLGQLLKENRRSFHRALVVTDTIFSMDGDLAPLQKLVDLAKRFEVITMVDEAHAMGVFGDKGSGLVESLNLEKEIDVRMGTLSKAVGSVGGYVAGSIDLINWLINRSRTFIYDTSLPSGDVAASLKAIDIIEKDSPLRQKLWDNIEAFRSGLKELRVDAIPSASAICCIRVGDIDKTMAFSGKLYEKGIWAPAIRPPTVKNSRIRFTLMATHTPEDINRALSAIKTTSEELGFLP